MASANDGDRAAAGILRLLLGMAAGAPVPSAMQRGGGGGPGVLLVQQFILDGDGDLFSSGVGGGVPPASKAAIAALKEVKAEEVESGGPLGDCAICLDGVEDAGKEMPCGHRFHGECLERWLGVHGNCPTCRHELPPTKEENSAAAEGGEERRRPRAAFLVSYLVVGGQREEAQAQQQPEPEREEPWNIRIEDVD